MMRLFVGLGLTQSARDALHQAVSALGIQGQMTAKENYHLTLAFLGERDQQCGRIEAAMLLAAQSSAPFTLATAGFGFFGKQDNALLYAKLQVSKPLLSLATAVRTRLCEAGEVYDEKPFAAHITLMRKADVSADQLHTTLPAIGFPADRLTLYHSARVQGLLQYRPVFDAKLGKEKL